MSSKTAYNPKGPKRILVVQSGFVFIGYEVERTSARIVLEEASCIRRWGTTKGLGQIALTGPTKDTLLDPCGTLTVPVHAELFSIDCKV